MRSKDSTSTLEFSLTVDGRQMVTKPVKFAATDTLSFPLEGVTVIKVGVRTIGSCANDFSTALLTRVWVQG